MIIGYQGEAHSYSSRAVTELYGQCESHGHPTFAAAFDAFERGRVDRLVLPIENSTTGSILPVLDRLPDSGRSRPLAILAEHFVEVRHALLGLPGSDIGQLKEVWSHPEALAQAEGSLDGMGLTPRAVSDTAGAVREIAEAEDPTLGALAPAWAAEAHGLEVLRSDLMDRAHNTTRFVVVGPPPAGVPEHADKTTLVFTTGHTPGALALALTDLGLRGANLTRIESRPADERWSYRFFADLIHAPGPAGVSQIVSPRPTTCAHLEVLGSYEAARMPG